MLMDTSLGFVMVAVLGLGICETTFGFRFGMGPRSTGPWGAVSLAVVPVAVSAVAVSTVVVSTRGLGSVACRSEFGTVAEPVCAGAGATTPVFGTVMSCAAPGLSGFEF